MLLAAGLALPIAAQAPIARAVPDAEARAAALGALERTDHRKAGRTEDRGAQRKERELLDRLGVFADSWNKLMQGAAKGVWNAKEAQKAHKAFERLLQCEGWVEK